MYEFPNTPNTHRHVDAGVGAPQDGGADSVAEVEAATAAFDRSGAVSYTHLTLPTILLV